MSNMIEHDDNYPQYNNPFHLGLSNINNILPDDTSYSANQADNEADENSLMSYYDQEGNQDDLL